jgi:hypothetical protein
VLLVDIGVKVNSVALKWAGQWVRIRYGDRFCKSACRIWVALQQKNYSPAVLLPVRIFDGLY